MYLDFADIVSQIIWGSSSLDKLPQVHLKAVRRILCPSHQLLVIFSNPYLWITRGWSELPDV